MSSKPTETWGSGDAYEGYVGRWSRKVAAELLRWLGVGRGLAWADVGCGTGALAETILATCEPASIEGVDASEGFVSHARQRLGDPRVRFVRGDATRLPWEPAAFDVTVSGLVLNFVADHEAMVREMTRVTKPGGRVAVYVWDYAGGMQMVRHFWDAAVAVNPHDAKLDQADRFPVCRPGPLRALFEASGLRLVETRALEIPTVFRDFDDYWSPFLGRQGSAPTYLASLSDEGREKIRSLLESRLAPPPGRPIELTARAWAVQGIV
ncbi:MAG: methyltransferase domain-containing protein [Candidatus Rokuibacteriota bacterium]